MRFWIFFALIVGSTQALAVVAGDPPDAAGCQAALVNPYVGTPAETVYRQILELDLKINSTQGLTAERLATYQRDLASLYQSVKETNVQFDDLSGIQYHIHALQRQMELDAQAAVIAPRIVPDKPVQPPYLGRYNNWPPREDR